MEMALPALRSDYRAIERYSAEPGAVITAPITALTGDRDPRATAAEVAAWRQHTTGSFEVLTFGGGHFFLTEHAARIIPLIADRLSAASAAQ
jgi:pyochelin biosynthetic protein PchC